MDRALACSLLALLSSCSTPPTQILIVADTDFEVPSELTGLRFSVRGPRGNEQHASADFAAGEERPAVLSLVHRGGPLEPFDVLVTAEPESLGARRAARVAFVPGRVVVVAMDVLRGCANVTCGPDETCSEMGCRPIGEPTDPPDGSVPPADARIDSGIDAGADTGSQPECRSALHCDDGIPCTVEMCEDGICAHLPDAARCADDGHACTLAVCDPLLGCAHAPDHALCDDGDPCTRDRCDGALGCLSAPDTTACDDGIACTIDRCDRELGCSSTPDDARCDDGIACTAERCDGIDGCVIAPVDTACGAGEVCDPSRMGCARAPTFTDVYALVVHRCGPCHTNRSRIEGGLDLSSRALAWANLVNVPALCGEGNILVVPRDPRASLFWRKLTGGDLCGEPMPPARDPLPAAEIAVIEGWIRGGAMDD